MTAPAGSISLAAEYAAATLADCPAFQSWTASADSTQARGRIYLEALPPPADGEEHTLDELRTLRPFALLSTTSFGRMQIAAGNGFDFGAKGSLTLLLEADNPSEIKDQNAEVMLRFYNAIGGILDELCERAGKAGFLAFTALDMPFGAGRSHPNDYPTIGDIMGTRIDLTWEQQ